MSAEIKIFVPGDAAALSVGAEAVGPPKVGMEPLVAEVALPKMEEQAVQEV